ncbi:MAG: hypothetical protein WAS36_04575 [Candidatus Saccharimonadales bacterium]
MKFHLPRNLYTKVALLTGALLLIPLVGMMFSDDVQWSLGDFIIAGVLIAGTGFGFDILSRSTKNGKQKLVIGIVLGIAFLLVWAELAVGLFGTPFAGN